MLNQALRFEFWSKQSSSIEVSAWTIRPDDEGKRDKIFDEAVPRETRTLIGRTAHAQCWEVRDQEAHRGIWREKPSWAGDSCICTVSEHGSLEVIYKSNKSQLVQKTLKLILKYEVYGHMVKSDTSAWARSSSVGKLARNQDKPLLQIHSCHLLHFPFVTSVSRSYIYRSVFLRLNWRGIQHKALW